MAGLLSLSLYANPAPAATSAPLHRSPQHHRLSVRRSQIDACAPSCSPRLSCSPAAGSGPPPPGRAPHPATARRGAHTPPLPLPPCLPAGGTAAGHRLTGGARRPWPCWWGPTPCPGPRWCLCCLRRLRAGSPLRPGDSVVASAVAPCASRCGLFGGHVDGCASAGARSYRPAGSNEACRDREGPARPSCLTSSHGR